MCGVDYLKPVPFTLSLHTDSFIFHHSNPQQTSHLVNRRATHGLVSYKGKGVECPKISKIAAFSFVNIVTMA